MAGGDEGEGEGGGFYSPSIVQRNFPSARFVRPNRV